ncbi:MAG TPA: short-chain dehydrogenase [Rhodospirillaceae bacterium]|nr:short-chain dehydrogenase [Rhodospirillaceae bacterium]HAT34750.1 short-chain dehydrogenase [Rhodospirillaceae bacterium]
MPKSPDYFRGKTLLMTGGASGIGKATADVFAREGANVVVTDIDEEGAISVAQAVDQSGGSGLGLRCDVTDRADVDKTVAETLDRFGSIDFLFNSAGSAIKRAKFLDIDIDLWQKTYDLNVTGTFHCMQAVIPQMLEQGKGVIVNMASNATRTGGAAKSPHYASAKGAVHTLTIGVGREFGAQGVRCLSLSPSAVDTPFQDISSQEMLDASISGNPMNRMGRPEEIAELVLFTCSDACEFINGDTLYVTGGAKA